MYSEYCGLPQVVSCLQHSMSWMPWWFSWSETEFCENVPGEEKKELDISQVSRLINQWTSFFSQTKQVQLTSSLRKNVRARTNSKFSISLKTQQILITIHNNSGILLTRLLAAILTTPASNASSGSRNAIKSSTSSGYSESTTSMRWYNYTHKENKQNWF